MEAWAARQRAEGATITAKEQIASIERPANEAEKALIAARADRRREKQAEYRERRQALGQGKPAEPRATPTRLDRLPERYGWRQVTFGLADYTEYKIEGDTLINTVTGARREQPTIRDLALAWAGLLDEGADMPTLTAMSHDKYEGADHEQAQATIADAAPAADSDDPLLDDLSRVGPPIDRGLSDRRHVDVSQTLWLKRGNGQRTGASRRGMENGRHAQYARPDTPGHVSRGVRPYARLDDRIRVPGMAVRLAGTAYELPPDTEGKRADKAHVCHPSGGRAEPTNARLTRHLFDYGGDPVVERVNGLPYTAAMLRRREARLAGEG
jgi:hypothetical protein